LFFYNTVLAGVGPPGPPAPPAGGIPGILIPVPTTRLAFSSRVIAPTISFTEAFPAYFSYRFQLKRNRVGFQTSKKAIHN
jgi:hypothetical protein